jgi:hypothetical protein
MIVYDVQMDRYLNVYLEPTPSYAYSCHLRNGSSGSTTYKDIYNYGWDRTRRNIVLCLYKIPVHGVPPSFLPQCVQQHYNRRRHQIRYILQDWILIQQLQTMILDYGMAS